MTGIKGNSIHQLWDKLFKIISDRFPEEIVRFVFPDKHIELCGKYEQEKVLLDYQVADINFWIRDQGQSKLLNIEPYSTWADTIPAVVFTLNAIITKSLRYRYEVISVVVLLEKTAPAREYQVTLEGQTVNRYQFPIVSFADIDRILQDYPCLAPFVPKLDRNYQNKVIETVKNDGLLIAMTVLVLNRLGMASEEALKMLGDKQEFMQALLEVPIMQDLWQEELQKIKAEAEKTIAVERAEAEKNKAQAEKAIAAERAQSAAITEIERKEAIKDLLEIKFRVKGAKLFAKIHAIKDPAVLLTIKGIIKTAENIDEVEEYLDSLPV